MKVSSKASAALSLAASSSSFGRSTRSILLRTASRGFRASPSVERIDCVSSVRLALAGLLAGVNEQHERVGVGRGAPGGGDHRPVEAALGREQAGRVDEHDLRLASVSTPRTVDRVVCALRVTIETFSPTSALIRVDLPALGAPMMATKPHRVSLMSRSSGRERPAPPPVPRRASSSRRRLPARSRRA